MASHSPNLGRADVDVPRELDSPGAKLVYLYLCGVEQTRIDDIARSLDIPQLSVVPVIDHLVACELVERTGDAVAPVPR